MASQPISAAKLAANIANPQFSCGPTTSAGKATSSKNGITHDLFAATDLIREGEEAAYEEFTAGLLQQLRPVGYLEQGHAEEIRRALWRLRRCGHVESKLSDAGLDPMESPGSDAEKIQKSVDRARSQTSRLLRQATAELRRLQTERNVRVEFLRDDYDSSDLGIADCRTVMKAASEQRRLALQQRKIHGLDGTMAIMKAAIGGDTPPLLGLNASVPESDDADPKCAPSSVADSPVADKGRWSVADSELGLSAHQPVAEQSSWSVADSGSALSLDVPVADESSWSSVGFALQNGEPQSTSAPRNAKCPCGSGVKYKRCHGKEAPPVLNVA